MLKYRESKIVFSEVPDEISLAISISGCPNRCPGCHSSYLWEDSGDLLDLKSLAELIRVNPGITCVCLLGGDSEPATITSLVRSVKEKTSLKTCWYSGAKMDYGYEGLKYLDFIKTGPYIKELGALDSPTTNQRFYTVNYDKLLDTIELKDKTDLFLKV